MRIGILENDSDIQDVFEHACALHGHTAHSYSWAQPLLDQFFLQEGEALSSPYDVLLVDLGLSGGISGEEVIARLFQGLPAERIPAIIVVSGASAGTLERVRRAFPSIAVLSKPVRLHTLLKTIEERGAEVQHGGGASGYG